MPDLHPKLQAALERDGVTVGKLAQVVGLDARTVARWGSEDEYGSRAAAFRRLEDVIAGRARVVETEVGSFDLEVLDGDIPRAHVLKAVESARAAVVIASNALTNTEALLKGGEVTQGLREFIASSVNMSEKSNAQGLTRPPVQVILDGMLNPTILRAAADDLESSTRGVVMTNVSIKLPPGYKEDLEAMAAEYGMNWAQYLRALGHLFRKPRKAKDSQ